MTRKRSCLGCMAYEDSMWHGGNGWCRLGYKTKRIKGVAGCYGRGGIIIGCNAAPVEECPKPWTVKEFLKLWREKNAAQP